MFIEKRSIVSLLLSILYKDYKLDIDRNIEDIMKII